jgi:hypothetical protein
MDVEYKLTSVADESFKGMTSHERCSSSMNQATRGPYAPLTDQPLPGGSIERISVAQIRSLRVADSREPEPANH